jgi:hypothetical protein
MATLITYFQESGIRNQESIVSVASLQNQVKNGSRAKKCIRLYDFFDAFMETVIKYPFRLGETFCAQSLLY